MTAEVWKPVVGYEGQYEVSDQGRVKSLRYRGFNGPPTVLKSYRNSDGYHEVTLRGGRQFRVHILVLEAPGLKRPRKAKPKSPRQIYNEAIESVWTESGKAE